MEELSPEWATGYMSTLGGTHTGLNTLNLTNILQVLVIETLNTLSSHFCQKHEMTYTCLHKIE